MTGKIEQTVETVFWGEDEVVPYQKSTEVNVKIEENNKRDSTPVRPHQKGHSSSPASLRLVIEVEATQLQTNVFF